MPTLARRPRFRPVPSLTDHELYAPVRSCTLCALRSGCQGPVPGVGPITARVVLVGEAPGENEDAFGIPFTGATWEELESLLSIPDLTRDDVFLTNTIRCRPDRDPTLADAHPCADMWLPLEIATIRPAIVVAMGQIAIRTILGDASLLVETTHGYPVWKDEWDCWVLPIYHPAAGFYDGAVMAYLRDDFTSLKELLEGRPRQTPVDPYDGQEDYVDIDLSGGLTDNVLFERQQRLFSDMSAKGVFAFDTETKPDNSMYCWSASSRAGTGLVGDPHHLFMLQPLFDDPDAQLIMHNAPFDLVQLRQMGIRVKCQVHDTLIMARILQLESGRLKDLSRRRLGMRMEDYSDLVEPAQVPLALDYLRRALDVANDPGFPQPAPVSERRWDAKKKALVTKERRPQPLAKKLKGLIRDLEAGKVMKAGEPVDPVRRWREYGDETAPVVTALGPFPIAYLAHVERAKTVFYSSRDSDSTLRLFENLSAELTRRGLWDIYELDRAAMLMVVDFMDYGVAIDRGFLAGLNREFYDREEQLTVKAGELAGVPFNPNSSKQVADVLFRQLKLPPGRLTDSEEDFSTDDEVLKPIASKHPVVPVVLEARRMRKLRSAYGEPTLRYSAGNGRAASDWTGMANTGRLTSKRINQMAIPQRSKDGKAIRNGFVSTSAAVAAYWERGEEPPAALVQFWMEHFGGEETVLIAADYSQIELRVLAHEAKVIRMIEAFLAGKDLHRDTAARMFNVPYAEVDPHGDQRDVAKRINFGIAYGIEAKGLHTQLDQEAPGLWTVGDCESWLTSYREIYPEIPAYAQNQAAHARRYGYVTDLAGRQRLIPEVKSPRLSKRNEGERFCGNFPVQSGAQSLMKMAMRDINRRREWGDWLLLQGLPLLQVHDALYFEVRRAVANEYAQYVQMIMEHQVELVVPTPVDVKMGSRLGELAAELED